MRNMKSTMRRVGIWLGAFTLWVGVASWSGQGGPVVTWAASAKAKAKKKKPAVKRKAATSQLEKAIAGIQTYYQSVKTLCVKFRQVFKAPRLSRPQKESGKFYYKKPGKLRFLYQRPEPKDFIYNGVMKTLWMYYPEDQEVKVRYNLSRSQFGVAMQFLWGSGNLKRSFRIKQIRDNSFGKPNDIKLELTPKKPQTVLRKLYFAVNPKKYWIRETIYTDPAGNRNRFIFSKFRRNAQCKLLNSVFNFKVPKGVDKTVVK